MPTIEERLQTLEQEHSALKKTIELQTIAIGALVNKATLEKLNEKSELQTTQAEETALLKQILARLSDNPK